MSSPDVYRHREGQVQTIAHAAHGSGIGPMALGAAGVVFGDIGTSLLYTINEINNHAHIQGDPSKVFGACSLVFWALTLIMGIKYPVFVLRADNGNEGGTFALLALLKEQPGKFVALLTGALLIGAAAFLLGEGVLTPCMSVLSAWEGTKPITGWFTEDRVVWFTFGTLIALFAVQYKGTAVIGRVAGVWMLVWFLSIMLIGGMSVARHPEIILGTLNPVNGIRFLIHEWRHSASVLGVFAILGSVTLCFTGGEALYADMGHFSRASIRLAWALIYPCLLVNYMGQGARLLESAPLLGREFDAAGHLTYEGNVFFTIVPGGNVGLVIMVVQAVGATVIASQALISGAYSVCRSAIALGLLPRMEVQNTSSEHEGQVYMPLVNGVLCVLCLIIVWWKRSSTNRAAAYGLAVTWVMLTTSLAMIAIAIYRWEWPRWKALLVFVPFLLIDGSFFTANLSKFPNGGYIPVVLGATFYYVMTTWRKGNAIRASKMQHSEATVDLFAESLRLEATGPNLVRSNFLGIFLSANPDSNAVPLTVLHHFNRLHSLPLRMLWVTVVVDSTRPYVPADERCVVSEVPLEGERIRRVILRYGYQDRPQVHQDLQDRNLTEMHQTYFAGRETLVRDPKSPLSALRWRVLSFLSKNVARRPELYFGLPITSMSEDGVIVAV